MQPFAGKCHVNHEWSTVSDAFWTSRKLNRIELQSGPGVIIEHNIMVDYKQISTEVEGRE